MGPEPVLEQVRALLAQDVSAMKKIAADLAWAREPIQPITSDAELFATYNIQVEKTRIADAGYCKAGPLRPPYHIWPDAYREAAREHAKRWRELCAKYAKATAAAQ
jgi:hypothetical protein